MNGSDWKSDKHPIDKVIELEAKLKDAEGLIEKLADVIKTIKRAPSMTGEYVTVATEVLKEALSAHAEWRKSYKDGDERSKGKERK